MSQYRDLVKYVNSRVIGRVALGGDDQSELLCQLTATPGLHLEIGCLWGGTAILAALAKREAGAPGHVLTLDIMQGVFWERGDPDVNKLPAPQDVYMNFIRFGVEGMISLLRCSSYPWPFSDNLHPDTALIDGDHSHRACLHDWQSLSKVTKNIIMFHDYEPKYAGVYTVVNDTVRHTEGWRECARVGALIAFERTNAISIGHPADIQQAPVTA